MKILSGSLPIAARFTLPALAVLLVLTMLVSACAPVAPASGPDSTGPESAGTQPANPPAAGSGSEAAETPSGSPPERPTQPLPGGLEAAPGKGGIQVPETPVIGEVPEELLSQIYQDMQTNFSVSQDQAVLVRAESVIWPDGSLGCPQPGVMYTQALVEGYWIQFMVGDQVYDYRATQNGSFQLCPQGRSAPPLLRSGTPTN
jgi:hypothetical protein